jgi:hypothetical protein
MATVSPSDSTTIASVISRIFGPFGDNQTGVPAGQSNIVGALID